MAQPAPLFDTKEATVVKKTAFGISGTGSLMMYAIRAGIHADLVFADRPCEGIELAKELGIDTLIINKDDYGVAPGIFDDNRDRFSLAVAEELVARGIELVSLAGWDTILSAPYFDTYKGLTINNHPAILPAFKGSARAVRDAIRACVLVTGYTIHVATVNVDDGEFLEQEAVRVLPSDTEESLHERIKKLERPGLVRVMRELLGLPEEEPYCYRCAIPMVAAGSSHTCPRCATIAGERS